MNLARKALLILPILFVLAMPLAVSADSAAVGSANWHIIPDACKCENSAPDFGCVLQVTQNVMNLGVYLALILMTIAIATAGFLWIFAPISAQNREMAKSTLTNAVIGIVIVLSAWLVVDFVMKKLYGQDNAWGPWNEILHANGGECIRTIASTGTQPSTNNNGSQGGVQTTPNPPAPNTSTGNCPAADPSGMVAFPASVTVGETLNATPQTVQNFLAMRAAAQQAGFDIKVVDGYRSDAEQLQLWNQNCSSGTCHPATAKPCSLGGSGSNHNSGQALDLTVGCARDASSCNSGIYNWLTEHGSQWNFRHSFSGDWVHWSANGH